MKNFLPLLVAAALTFAAVSVLAHDGPKEMKAIDAELATSPALSKADQTPGI